MNSLILDADSVQDESCDWFPPAWSLQSNARSPFRVLVCEPRAGLRRQIAAAFRQAGLEACFAASAGEAACLAGNGRFHVAVVDPEMERNTGLGLCARLARGRLGVPVPVVSWCESRSIVLAIRSRLAGSRAHLMRPVALDRFVNTVWEVASAHAGEDDREAARRIVPRG